MMMKTSLATAGLAVAPKNTSPVRLDRFASPDGRPSRVMPLMRKYEVAHLTPSSSEIQDFTRIAPALPAFENAFAVLGRGAVVQTENGHVAVGDLLPGDKVKTVENGYQTLLWHGSMQIVPGARNPRPEMATLTRITADAMGLGRPNPDLVLGPSARLHHIATGIRALTGSTSAFIPVRDFIDGNQIIELRPMAAVRVFQLGFENHERINVNGIEIETLHPGPAHMLGLRHDMMGVFMSLFPHKATMADFGKMAQPRLQLRDLQDMFDLV